MLDLAVVGPSILLAGILVLHRLAIGNLMAATVLVMTLLLAPALLAMTGFQLAAGITFTPGEVVGPVLSFTVIGLAGMIMAAVLLRDIGDNPRIVSAP